MRNTCSLHANPKVNTCTRLKIYFHNTNVNRLYETLQYLMYSLDLKTVDKVVYRRENSSVQAKVDHDEPAKIRPRRTGLTSLSGLESCIGSGFKT
jgi:hypothetical protein